MWVATALVARALGMPANALADLASMSSCLFQQFQEYIEQIINACRCDLGCIIGSSIVVIGV